MKQINELIEKYCKKQNASIEELKNANLDLENKANLSAKIKCYGEIITDLNDAIEAAKEFKSAMEALELMFLRYNRGRRTY